MCHLPAGHGTDHPGFGTCKRHGGSTRQSRLAAERQAVSGLLATYGEPIDVDPAQALLSEVQRTAGHVEWLGRILAALPPEELTFGRAEVVSRPAPSGDGSVYMVAEEIKARAGAHQIVQLYQAERKHLVFVSKAAIDAGASMRMVEMFTEVGAAYVSMIERVLDALELSPAQAARVPQLLTGELEQITRSST